jgi:peptidyl-prolyl cis-trans isomerase D
MLDAMRRGAVNWLAKLLLFLLIIAFGIWGVADVFRGYRQGTLARIGNTEISVEAYRQAYQDELASISRRIGRRLTIDQARMLGIDQRALQRLIGGAAVDAHVHELHLALSQSGVADIIRADAAFRDASGAFSNAAFRSYLRQSGNSEGSYVALRRKDELREHITDSLRLGVAPPQVLIDLLHAYREETRSIAFFTPDFDKLITIAVPDEAKIRAYYENNNRQFTSPELRKVNLIALTRGAVKARVAVSDEEVKAAYEQDKDRYSIPEKRRISQLAYPDMAAAEKAYAELAKAGDFAAAAARLGFKESDFDLGLLTRRDMIDDKIAASAFALKQGELSKPVEGQFSIVLLRVGEIVPGKQRTFEEVKDEIKDQLADERAAEEIQTLHDHIEDQRNAGKSLKEIAEALKLPFHEVATIDRSGNTAEGNPADVPEPGRIAAAAFSGAVGIEAEPTELADGGEAWVDVLAVIPEKLKAFADVIGEAKDAVIAEERRKEILALSGKLVERLSKGEEMAAIVKEVGGKLETTPQVTRRTVPQGLTANAVSQAFALPKGGATSSPTPDGKGRMILRVVDVVRPPPPTPEQSQHLRAELSDAMQGDLLTEYVDGLKARYGWSVNGEAIKQVLGGTDTQQPDLE